MTDDIQRKKDSLRQAVRDWAVSRDLTYFYHGMGRVYPTAAAAREVAKEARNLGLKTFVERSFIFAEYPSVTIKHNVPWTFRRHASGMVEVLEGSKVITFWAAPKHRQERADRHEQYARQIVDDHNVRLGL